MLMVTPAVCFSFVLVLLNSRKHSSLSRLALRGLDDEPSGASSVRILINSSLMFTVSSVWLARFGPPPFAGKNTFPMNIRDTKETLLVTNADLSRSSFTDVNLHGARFADVNLSKAQFCGHQFERLEIQRRESFACRDRRLQRYRHEDSRRARLRSSRGVSKQAHPTWVALTD